MYTGFLKDFQIVIIRLSIMKRLKSIKRKAVMEQSKETKLAIFSVGILMIGAMCAAVLL